MTFVGQMWDISGTSHGLLEPPSPAYSSVTVRRAFVVWMCCGQRNQFKDVCNYFHHLEALEDQLPPERRALSRHHEFNLFSNHPPTSTYLLDNFPQLYKESSIDRSYISKVEEIRTEKCVFKLEGFSEITPKKGTTTHEIVEASRMIRKYCRTQMVSLKKFLDEFKQHAMKCDLKYTVINVAFYIKRKMVQAEIELEANYPKTLGFLNSSSVDDLLTSSKEFTTYSNSKKNDVGFNITEGNRDKFKPIKILRKGSEDDKDITKKYWSNTNEIDKNHDIFTKADLGRGNDDNLKLANYNRTENMTSQDITLISLDDSTDENIPMMKERRFSGSQFMKVELEKFRKI